MTDRRKILLVLLVPLIGLPYVGLSIGPIEVALWLAFLMVWLVAFLFWGNKDSGHAA